MFIAKHRTRWNRHQVIMAGLATSAAMLTLLWLYNNHWFTSPVVNYLKNLVGVK
jgi:hypothetical protein